MNVDTAIRQAKLKCWMKSVDIDQGTIAEALGCTKQRVSCLLRKESLTAEVRTRFTALGIPGELLPPEGPAKKSGRRRPAGRLPITESVAVAEGGAV